MSTSSSKPARLYFIDNIRILLTILVVVVHVGVAYSGNGRWYYNEQNPDMVSTAVIGWFLSVSAAFFMGLFFMISGYFLPGSYERKGAWRFIKDRLLRLGIPFLAFIVLFNPILSTNLNYFGWSTIKAVYVNYLFANPQLDFGIVTGPVWFLLILLILTSFYLIDRLIADRLRQSGGTLGVPGHRAFIGFALLLSIVTYLIRIRFPMNQWLRWGIINNFFEPAHIFQYLCLFLAGIAAYHSGWFDRWSKKIGRTWRIVSGACILLWPVMMFAGGALSGNISIFFGGSSWQALAYASWESFLCVSLCVGLLTGFRDVLNRSHPVLAAMAASAFTVYLIHAPIITFMQRYLGGIQLNPMIKFGLVTAVGVPLCFLIAGVVRKMPIINRIL